VAGAPEVWVDDPLCPADKESLWSTTPDGEAVASPVLAGELVALVKQPYKSGVKITPRASSNTAWGCKTSRISNTSTTRIL